MPRASVYFYREEKGETPVLEWLRGLRRSDARAYTKCVAAVQELAARGHELRRRALRRKKLFQARPERHTHQEELSDV